MANGKSLISLMVGFVCMLCVPCLSFSATNIPTGDIGEYGNWLTVDNSNNFNTKIKEDFTKFQGNFEEEVNSKDFVPIEVKIGLDFMEALSMLDDVLQKSLVRFVIMFLFIIYAFWVGINAYQMIRDSTDYKTVLYDIFKQGLIIAFWVLILNYGAIETFSTIIDPILSLGTTFSDFILNSVANTYKAEIPNTCATIKNFVATNADSKLLLEPETAANIMCLPARLSMFFYHAVNLGFKWMGSGFGTNPAAIFVGAVAVVIFIKCIFKYAFMTLGIATDLFLKLLMLPFTALAEALPSSAEKSYIGQIFNGFLKVFHTQKLSAVIAAFINTAIYFISLSIIIAICAALLSSITFNNFENDFSLGTAMVTILTGALVLHLINRTDELTKQIGGSINNSFGEDMQKSIKTLWGDTKNISKKFFNAWLKKK